MQCFFLIPLSTYRAYGGQAFGRIAPEFTIYFYGWVDDNIFSGGLLLHIQQLAPVLPGSVPHAISRSLETPFKQSNRKPLRDTQALVQFPEIKVFKNLVGCCNNKELFNAGHDGSSIRTTSQCPSRIYRARQLDYTYGDTIRLSELIVFCGYWSLCVAKPTNLLNN